jgi:hypothetical protein
MSRRALVLLLCAAQALFWAWTITIGLSVSDQRTSDGLQWMAAFFATPPFVVLTLPAAALVLLRRALNAALWLALLGAVLVPYIGWSTLIARLGTA